MLTLWFSTSHKLQDYLERSVLLAARDLEILLTKSMSSYFWEPWNLAVMKVRSCIEMAFFCLISSFLIFSHSHMTLESRQDAWTFWIVGLMKNQFKLLCCYIYIYIQGQSNRISLSKDWFDEMYIKYIMKEIQQLVQCSALKSSLKTAKRPQKDQTRLEKDWTTGLGFLVLRFMDQKKTSLLIF